MLPFGYTVLLQTLLSLTVLSDNIFVCLFVFVFVFLLLLFFFVYTTCETYFCACALSFCFCFLFCFFQLYPLHFRYMCDERYMYNGM